MLTSTIHIDTEPVVCIAADNGNTFFKGAILDSRGQLKTVIIPTAYCPHIDDKAGTTIVRYRVKSGDTAGDTFAIGHPAIARGGAALMVGSTAERLPDLRQREFLLASIIELLLAGGYTAGAHTLLLGFAIPNIEVERVSGRGMGAREDTRTALKHYLNKATFEVERIDARDARSTWTLTIQSILPQAQTLGTFIAWSHTPTGRLVTDVEAVDVLDGGGGDLQRAQIFVDRTGRTPSFAMSSERLGDGSVVLAQALRRKLHERHRDMTDIAAHIGLMTGKATIHGKPTDIRAEVADVQAIQGRELQAKMLPVLRQTGRYVVVSGGLAVLLRGPILAALDALSKREPDDALVINHGLAPITNVVGTLFAVLFAAAARRR
ncbi:MAG TPA: hypothetical protein VFZ66_27660 [Herpetosiphonaceae bacterium]